MNYIFCDWEDFAYLKEEASTIDITKQKDSPKSGVKKSFKKAVVPILAAFAIGLTTINSPCGAFTTAPPVIKRKFEKNLLQTRLKTALKLMRLTLTEATEMMGVGYKTLQDFLEEKVEEPNPRTLQKYGNFLDLFNELNKFHKGKPFAITSSLRTPMRAFGEKSLLEYASSNEDSMDYIIATVKRIYG